VLLDEGLYLLVGRQIAFCHALSLPQLTQVV
jgi:hypothetical protein